MVSTVIKETPVKFLKTAVKTVSNKSRYNRLLKTRNNFSYHAWKKDTVNREIFVLLIGESSRYSNWQINGYDRNTSPLIMKKNVLSYSDVSSTSFLTSYSVMSMLTGEPFTDGVTVLKRKSFISAFKQCGFKVYWITDQPGMGSKPEFFINEADVVQKLECPQGRCYDEEVVQSMDKILKKNEPRILLILHTMGSHFEFYKRYPRQFDHFKPSWRGSLFTFSANKKKAMVINSYDNSILYTDYIISSVIDKISAKNTLSAVMYVSDHAENLYDYNNIFLPRAKAGYSQYLFHVPLFIWTSDLYKESFPEKFKVLQENRNQKISVDNIFSTILDMANIAYDGEDLTRSFADTTYTSEERKIYVGSDQVLVYDSLRSN